MSVQDFRAGIKTAGEMAGRRWSVLVRCDRCGFQRPVDLAGIIANPRLGPDFAMWNRRPRCRNSRCNERAYLWARMPGHPMFEPLMDGPPARLSPPTSSGLGSWQYGTATVGGQVVSRPFEAAPPRRR